MGSEMSGCAACRPSRLHQKWRQEVIGLRSPALCGAFASRLTCIVTSLSCIATRMRIAGRISCLCLHDAPKVTGEKATMQLRREEVAMVRFPTD